ncbi:uncharacterized protein VTP21DRAFT_10756 [Calcarisporiella thermophila]|uniref:uncharacterized protein n=1 Tax=Calcarisporiella thermophila TaxID=911321 RepID=UPI0037423957
MMASAQTLFRAAPRTLPVTPRYPLARLRQPIMLRRSPTSGNAFPRRSYSTAPPSPSSPQSTVDKPSKPGKFKELMKKYGPMSVVVYMGVSTIDLGATFAILQIAGGEHVLKIEDWCKENLGFWKKLYGGDSHEEDQAVAVVEKEKAQGNGQPSVWTVFAIAYGIHKLLVPLRLGLTAAITPPLVKKLQSMGWRVGIGMSKKA